MPGTFGSRRLLRRLARVAGTVRRSGSVNCVGLGGGKRMEPITASRQAGSRCTLPNSAPFFPRSRRKRRKTCSCIGRKTLWSTKESDVFLAKTRLLLLQYTPSSVMCRRVFNCSLHVEASDDTEGIKKKLKKRTTKGLSRSDGGLRRLLAYVSQAQLRAYLCDELVVV